LRGIEQTRLGLIHVKAGRPQDHQCGGHLHRLGLISGASLGSVRGGEDGIDGIQVAQGCSVSSHRT
jgi:hypothetical protein